MTDDRRRLAQEALAGIRRRMVAGEITEGEAVALTVKARAAAPNGELLARLARVTHSVVERVEKIETAGSTAPAALADTAAPVARGGDAPQSPLAAVWSSMETMARRLIAAEKGQAELLELLADQERRIAALEAEREGQP